MNSQWWTFHLRSLRRNARSYKKVWNIKSLIHTPVTSKLGEVGLVANLKSCTRELQVNCNMQQKLCYIFNSVLLKRNSIYSYSAFLPYIAQNYKVFKIITKCFKLSVSRHPLVSEPRLEAVIVESTFLYIQTKSLGFLVPTFFGTHALHIPTDCSKKHTPNKN